MADYESVRLRASTLGRSTQTEETEIVPLKTMASNIQHLLKVSRCYYCLHSILSNVLKPDKTLDENSFLSYGTSPAIRNHRVLPATRHKWTRPALTPTSKLVLDLYTPWMKRWVDLGYRQCTDRESNSLPLDHKSDALPLHYGATRRPWITLNGNFALKSLSGSATRPLWVGLSGFRTKLMENFQRYPYTDSDKNVSQGT